MVIFPLKKDLRGPILYSSRQLISKLLVHLYFAVTMVVFFLRFDLRPAFWPAPSES